MVLLIEHASWKADREGQRFEESNENFESVRVWIEEKTSMGDDVDWKRRFNFFLFRNKAFCPSLSPLLLLPLGDNGSQNLLIFMIRQFRDHSPSRLLPNPRSNNSFYFLYLLSSNSQDKRARKFIKRRIGTLRRAKGKMEYLTGVIAEQRRAGH